MNILILSWRGPGHPESGGAEISTHEHAKGWERAGNTVTLFTSAFKNGKPEEIIDGVKIVRRGFDIFGVHLLAFIWYIFGDHEKFDLVVDQFHGIPFFTPIYVKINKLAFIHEVTKEVWWLNPWPKPFNLIPAVIGTIFERFIFTLLYRSVPFMTVSESTKKDLIAWKIPEKNITVIHNGFHTLKVNFSKEYKNTLIHLGALTKDKGIEDSIEVFNLINQKYSNWQFWIVGKGESSYLNYIKIKINEFYLEDKIKFFGFVSQKEKFELLSKSSILINPSIREGWGLVNIEANFFGTPVVGYKVSGMIDSVQNGKTGILVKKGDVSGLASSIIRLFSDKDLYSRLSGNAISWSKKFSWEESGRKSLILINNICKK